MRKTEEKAYAKINIGLDVLGRREDGYHELKMVMQTIDLCDDVLLSWEEGGTDREIRILCDTPGVPCDRRNLAYRAAEAFFSCCSEKEGLLFPGSLEIRLVKRIPAAAGLAGGSSDAAAVLRGLDRMLGTCFGEAELRRIALPLPGFPYTRRGTDRRSGC